MFESIVSLIIFLPRIRNFDDLPLPITFKLNPRDFSERVKHPLLILFGDVPGLFVVLVLHVVLIYEHLLQSLWVTGVIELFQQIKHLI